jgi:transcriptional regulator with XRE-family HTH domain
MKNKIKMLRKYHRDTLKNLASKINYDYINLSNIERGLYEPSLELLRKIAEVYDVEMTFFFEENNDYSIEETHFLRELDLSNDELLNKFDFFLDSKKLSKKEFEFVIEIIRKLYESINENDNS